MASQTKHQQQVYPRLYEPPMETVTIAKKEYEDLKEDAAELNLYRLLFESQGYND